ncbi:hypothetical protein JKA74_18075 [Marivirga sp. S37H4]|uniref:Lipocalin-like domain-containing protein n=1 Tax=Marivirga aurantiaca TaxID=2802615 RepID=A0A934X1W3_9BACT|nr:hypothetical protein [Marivirga aurantiaca]MBK6266957.1 hypothetical protein [Marivirga aurantiaca]
MERKLKTFLFFGLAILLLIPTACDDDDSLDDIDDLNPQDNFEELLQAKVWVASSFIYDISCSGEESGDGGAFELVKPDFCAQINSDCSPCPEDDPDCTITCSDEYCGLQYEWLNYEANFTSSNLIGTHTFKKQTPIFDENGNTGEYEEENGSEVFTNSWLFNNDDNILTTNFGDVYNLFDGQDLLTFNFEIISAEVDKIVLKGQKNEQGCTLTIDIVLE